MTEPAQSSNPITTIEHAGTHAGNTVTIRGWLYNMRESGKLLFPIFRDGTGIMQGVVSLKEQPEVFAALKGLPQESSVIATGVVRAEARAPGGFEMGVTGIEIVQRVSDSAPYPIQLKEHGVDFLLDRRHLWIRTPRQAAILRILAGALGKVYTFGPTFRAEKSKTRRHLTEFWMLQPEAAYAHLEDMIQLAEGLVSAVVQSGAKNRTRELALIERDVAALEKIMPPFPRITYDDAIKVLQKAGNPAKWGDDLGR